MYIYIYICAPVLQRVLALLLSLCSYRLPVDCGGTLAGGIVHRAPVVNEKRTADVLSNIVFSRVDFYVFMSLEPLFKLTAHRLRSFGSNFLILLRSCLFVEGFHPSAIRS